MWVEIFSKTRIPLSKLDHLYIYICVCVCVPSQIFGHYHNASLSLSRSWKKLVFGLFYIVCCLNSLYLFFVFHIFSMLFLLFASPFPWPIPSAQNTASSHRLGTSTAVDVQPTSELKRGLEGISYPSVSSSCSREVLSWNMGIYTVYTWKKTYKWETHRTICWIFQKSMELISRGYKWKPA